MSGTRSNEVRDALVETLLTALKDGVPVVDGEGVVHKAPPPASLLAVAKDYIKAFPPSPDVPAASHPTGILKTFVDAAGKPSALPFTPNTRAN